MVSVRVYGWLSEVLGFRSRDLEFRGSLRELLELLGSSVMEMVEEGRIQVAVNHELTRDLSMILSEGDLVAIFPSFSGGSWRAGITRDRISPEELLREMRTDPDVGAVVLFLGVVRRTSGEGEVERIFYDCYPEVADREIRMIREEAIDRFRLKDAVILHRIGDVAAGEVALLVITRSAHRREAFEAAAWAVDEVKRRVPIWKKEVFSDGSSRWISE
ncbi:MAG: molybdopterin converting factor [Candidatus Korarchaeota archaeon NZ13-K]|nr:MAG: molybdopterin converting factor [Candidatus Korarchaeota archaeon NZ13-K]